MYIIIVSIRFYNNLNVCLSYVQCFCMFVLLVAICVVFFVVTVVFVVIIMIMLGDHSVHNYYIIVS